MTVYLSLEQALRLHEAQVRAFGGAPGLRDRGALESALTRPSMTFGGEDLYADLPAKAAALFHSLVVNHPFVDGNKRIAAAAAELFLLINRVELVALDADLLEITMATARGNVGPEALAIWFRQRTRDFP